MKLTASTFLRDTERGEALLSRSALIFVCELEDA